MTTKLVKSITLKSPIAKVFAYLEEPVNLPEIWPSLIDADAVERIPNGGTRLLWVYKLIGMRLEGTGETTEYLPNQKMMFKIKGGIEGTVTWVLQPKPGGTKVTFEAECTVPVRLLSRVTGAFIARGCEREAELILLNLKDRMEG